MPLATASSQAISQVHAVVDVDMDPERALQELLSSDHSSSSSESEPISLPSATALEREVLSSGDNEPETQFCFEHGARKEFSVSENSVQSQHSASPCYEMDTSASQVRITAVLRLSGCLVVLYLIVT